MLSLRDKKLDIQLAHKKERVVLISRRCKAAFALQGREERHRTSALHAVARASRVVYLIAARIEGECVP